MSTLPISTRGNRNCHLTPWESGLGDRGSGFVSTGVALVRGRPGQIEGGYSKLTSFPGFSLLQFLGMHQLTRNQAVFQAVLLYYCQSTLSILIYSRKADFWLSEST